MGKQTLIFLAALLFSTASFPPASGGQTGTGLTAESAASMTADATRAATRPPNVILIVADDLGYGDLGCYGNQVIRTPNIDRLAAGGVRFTSFYSCAAVCAPARAGLLTGRYPFRSGVIGNPYPEDEPITRWLPRKIGNLLNGLGVLDLRERKAAPGLPAGELTLAEVLKSAGYRTAMVGKWHLGDYSRAAKFNPLRHGFDTYLGVPHSNDMLPCPLYQNEKQLEADIGLNQARLTGMYTREALRFIRESGNSPFFLYIAHTFPHQPLFASQAFADRSPAGRFGDAVEEIDWSVGEIIACLKQNGLQDDTLVLFMSDNGPWFEGSPGALRGRKGQSYDGGFRVPFIANWPSRLPRGKVCEQPAVNIDLYPTLLTLAGAALPADRVVDGKDISGLLSGERSESPHEAIFFYHYDLLEGIRSGPWKYFAKINRYVWPIPLDAAAVPNKLGADQLGTRWPLLYNLASDPGESYNVINRYPEVAERLQTMMKAWETENRSNPSGFSR